MIPLKRQPKIAEKLFNAVWDQLLEGSAPSKESVYTRKLYTDVQTGNPEEVKRLHKLVYSLVTASPEQIRAIKDKRKSKYAEIRKWDFREMYGLLSNRSNRLGNNVTFTAEEFVDGIGVTVCPYCNRQYINNTIDKKGPRRSSQLDHFFPKNKFPFLALSFFNLIPICPSCNLKKHEGGLAISPYELESKQYQGNLDNKVDNYLRFHFTPTGADFTKDKTQIKVDINEKTKGDNSYKKRLALDAHYAIHKDYVSELIKKKELYAESYIKELFGERAGLFNSKEELRRALWGNYTTKDELHKRPLAKLTRDILREIAPEALED